MNTLAKFATGKNVLLFLGVFLVFNFVMTPAELVFVVGLVAWLIRSVRGRRRPMPMQS